MPRPKFDPSKVTETRWGDLYYEGDYLSSSQRKKYYKWVRQQSNPDSYTKSKLERATIQKKYTKYFSDKKFTSQQGHLKQWATPFSLKGGDNPYMRWHNPEYQDINGRVKKTSTSQKWGSLIDRQDLKKVGGTNVFNGSKQWIRQLEIAIHKVRIQSENFRVMVAKRALKVFQLSFKYKRFYSNNSKAWEPLSSYTLKKRSSRGTGSIILYEYGDLYNSLKVDEGGSYKKVSTVYTDVVPANVSHHKKRSLCYAGYHNEGFGTYGRGWGKRTPKHYIKRQFMGHSSYLDPTKNEFLRKAMKLYLFDSVFLVKKT